jgi:hypothetical protein
MPEFLPMSKKEADALDYPVYHAIYNSVVKELERYKVNPYAKAVLVGEDSLVVVSRRLIQERAKQAARRLVDRLSRL